MSAALNVGIAALAVVLVAGFAIWLGMRSARSEGRAAAQKGTAEKVADNARSAAEVRADVGGVDAATARERLRKWTRQ